MLKECDFLVGCDIAVFNDFGERLEEFLV